MADERAKLTHGYGQIDKDYGRFLATRPEAEDGPIFMVNLMKYHEVAQYDGDTDAAISGREADDKYNPSSILNKIGADIMFAADVRRTFVGADWDRIAIVRYPTRRTFIEMQTRKDFAEKHVHKNAGMARTVLPCCTPRRAELNTVDRPTGGLSLDHVVMVVSAGPFPGSTFDVEGTIVGDGRKWSNVHLMRVRDEFEADIVAERIQPPGDGFVMSLTSHLNGLV
ncbi:MAG: hypothetical protein KJS66_07725 [Acidobacteria bacterium]|nr:hypothetical protein [Acidobacteriota bacterium]